MNILQSKQISMQNQLSEFLIKAGLALLSYFSPCWAVTHAVLILFTIDWFTGVWASRIEGKRFTSYKMRKSVAKIAIYITAIIAVYVYDKSFTGESWHLVQIVGGYIGLTELKSIFENSYRITGKDVLVDILKLLTDRIKKG